MELEIRALTPELLGDYLEFFDQVAFADHPEWSQCYCMHFHWQSQWDDEPPKNNRDRAIEHVKGGLLKGYLAYADGKVAGWCNANDKKNYAALKCNVKPEIWEANEDEKVKSVVCFLVAPDLRGKGVATKLLEHACADAKVDGYDFIEGYPPFGDCGMYAAHHGTVALFEKFGFAVYKQSGNCCIMRKYLGNG